MAREAEVAGLRAEYRRIAGTAGCALKAFNEAVEGKLVELADGEEVVRTPGAYVEAAREVAWEMTERAKRAANRRVG